MRSRTVLLSLFASFLLLPAPGARSEEALADTGTIRLKFASREWLDVGLDVHGVTVDRFRLDRAGKVKGLFLDHDETNRGKIAVTNNTDRKVYPSVAIAILDAEGHLLAAANTGGKQLPLKPGVTEEFDIHFGGVFRHIDKGEFIYLSIEY